MFDFDELIFESYRIPWLIWIQLVVLFLLIIMLYFFSTSALDLSDHNSGTGTASLSGGIFITSGETHFNNPAVVHHNTRSSLHNSKIRENQIIEVEPGPSKSRRIVKSGEDSKESEGPSTKDVNHCSLFEHPHHPCHFLGLAKQAFLKCLGLDSTTPEISNSKKHRKKH